MVTYDGGNSFSWKAGLKSPLLRVEVSPDASPEPPRARLGLRTQRHSRSSSWAHGSFTIPTARPSLTEQSPRTLAQSSHRYARSEVVHGTPWYNSLHGAVNRPANQPVSQPRPGVLREDVLLHSTPYQTSEAQRVAMGSYGSQRQGGGQSGWGGQNSGSLGWLRQVRKDRETLKRRSYPPSVVSMEVDAGVRKEAVGLQAQQTAVTER